MDLDIFTKSIKQTNKNQNKCFLDILYSKDKSEIDLVAKDLKGEIIENGYLLRINKKGLFTYENVNPKIGFKLTKKGCIIIE